MTHDIVTRDAILRADLASFTSKVFQTVDPLGEYQHSWHIDLIADRLEAAYRGEIKRLIINMPPRNLKSVCASVSWPAWILGQNPAARIMVSSYSQALSFKHSLDCRLVMEAMWYRDMFPQTRIASGENEKAKFVTTKRGFRIATSTGGSVTGEGGDFLIVDDPHNALEAMSKTKRETTLNWFEQAFMSRLNDKRKGVVVVVMQRLHPHDLTGHLLGKKGRRWEQLCLPAIAAGGERFCIKKIIKIRGLGEVLNPLREDEGTLRMIQGEMGSFAFAAQYQQTPIQTEGGMIKLEWFGRYQHAPQDGVVVQSWDTATKTSKNNDFSACTTWCESKNAFYLLDVFARRMEYPDLKRTVVSHAEKWQPSAILIEDKASGQVLLQDLKAEIALPLIAISPTEDKITRFGAVTALIEAGKVLLPKSAAWLVEFEEEIMLFPEGAHDDRVDAFSQFLNWKRKPRGAEPRVRRV